MRGLLGVGVSLLAVAVTSCDASRVKTETDSTAAPAAAKLPAVIPASIPDTALLLTAGVPTDPDDTAKASYARRDAPRVIPLPACEPAGPAICIRDTATVSLPDDNFPEWDSNWLVFATNRDSLQFFAAPGMPVMDRVSAQGFVGEKTPGLDQYWLRYRFPETGTFVFTNRIGSDTAYAYQLRLIPTVSTAATRPIGRKATIELPGRERDRIAIAPEALAAGLADSAVARRHAVRPGLYRVLLVRDSVYVVCRLPCTNPHRVVLKDGTRTSISTAPSSN